MKTQRHPVTILAVLALALLLAPVVFAQGPGRGAGPGAATPGACWRADDGFGPDGACARLDLTDEQSEAIAKLREKRRQEVLQLRKENLRLRNELRGEMMKDDPDAGTVGDLVEKIGRNRIRLQRGRLEHQLAVRKLLTPEQRDRLLLMKGRGLDGGRCGGHRGHDLHGGPGHPMGMREGRGRGGSCWRDADGTGPRPQRERWTQRGQ